MQLTHLLTDLDALPDDTFICAKRPWTRECEVLLVPYPENFGIPQAVKDQGYEYLLEVDTTREILEGLLPHNPSHDQIVDFVLYYAEYDAFPDWANELCSQ